MNEINGHDSHSSAMSSSPALPYFAPLFPWQQQAWQRLTDTALQAESRLPHAMLASGMQGIGKRVFVWRWVAWQLCHNRHDERMQSREVACGHCESCHWLSSGTHPDLRVLPDSCSPTFAINAETTTNKKTSNRKKSAKATTKNTPPAPKIKIDDIRNIQNFVNQGSSNKRICVFDHADTMTIASANALLKTLEEPAHGVQLILITDHPALLLPTIKSRVQQLPLNKIEPTQASHYLQSQLPNLTAEQSLQLLNLGSYAPLQAVKIAQSSWYPLRELWLKTWLALKSGVRTATTASDYWQSQLELEEFITLTQLMLADLQRLSVSLPTYQQDIDFNAVNADNMPTMQSLQNIQLVLKQIAQSRLQNVQDKLSYDMLMQAISRL